MQTVEKLVGQGRETCPTILARAKIALESLEE